MPSSVSLLWELRFPFDPSGSRKAGSGHISVYKTLGFNSSNFLSSNRCLQKQRKNLTSLGLADHVLALISHQIHGSLSVVRQNPQCDGPKPLRYAPATHGAVGGLCGHRWGHLACASDRRPCHHVMLSTVCPCVPPTACLKNRWE